MTTFLRTLGRRACGAALILGALLIASASPVRATEIQRVTSPGGIEAWLVEEHTIPMIAVEIVFRGGSSLDPEGKDGLAYLVSGLLDEGAGALDSLAFQTRLEELAVGLSFEADIDGFGASLRTLSKHRDEAFRLLALALNEPRFDADPVERIRRQITAGLIRSLEDPDTIADRAWYAAAFPGHPYGRPTRGTVESIAAITVDDLRAFARQRFARDNVVIGVVGDIEPAVLGQLLDRTLGSLPETSQAPDIPEVAPQPGGAPIVIRKEIPQSVVTFGGAGLKRDDPDFYAGYVMNYILGGGGFNSRLTEEVREKRGLAYSVYSFLYPLDRTGLLIGGVGTANARVGDSLAVIRGELGRLRREGVSDQELADAKTYLNGSFPLQLASNSRIASFLVRLQLDGLGIDYFERRPELINAVTAADIRRVAERLLDPDRLIVVVVGAPEGVGDGG